MLLNVGDLRTIERSIGMILAVSDGVGAPFATTLLDAVAMIDGVLVEAESRGKKA